MRRPLEFEIESITVMLFENIEAVKAFVGSNDYTKSYVPPKAREILARFDEKAQHYVVSEHLVYG